MIQISWELWFGIGLLIFLFIALVFCYKDDMREEVDGEEIWEDLSDN